MKGHVFLLLVMGFSLSAMQDLQLSLRQKKQTRAVDESDVIFELARLEESLERRMRRRELRGLQDDIALLKDESQQFDWISRRYFLWQARDLDDEVKERLAALSQERSPQREQEERLATVQEETPDDIEEQAQIFMIATVILPFLLPSLFSSNR